MYYWRLSTPIGSLLIFGDDSALRGIEFPVSTKRAEGDLAQPQPGWIESLEGSVADAVEQLREYFAGERREFDLALNPEGTAFQKQVWRVLRELPYGETISYGELAARCGKPKAARAVGSANGANRIPIVIPCHRVIAADGTLGGFGGGLPTKQWLLELEARQPDRVKRAIA